MAASAGCRRTRRTPATCRTPRSAGSSRTASSIRPRSTRRTSTSTTPTIRHFVIQPEFTAGHLQHRSRTRVKARYCTYPTPVDTSHGTVQGLHRRRPADRAQRRRRLADGSARRTAGETQGRRAGDHLGQLRRLLQRADRGRRVRARTWRTRPRAFRPGTAKTSPYEYLTTAVYPACARHRRTAASGDRARLRLSSAGGPGDAGAAAEPELGQRLHDRHVLRRPAVPAGHDQRRSRSGAQPGDPDDGREPLAAEHAHREQRRLLHRHRRRAGEAGEAARSRTSSRRTGRTTCSSSTRRRPRTRSTSSTSGAGLPLDYAEQERLPDARVSRRQPLPVHRRSPDLAAGLATRPYDPTTGILTVTIDMGFDAVQDGVQAGASRTSASPPASARSRTRRCQCDEDGDFAKLCKDNKICKHVGRQGHRLAGWRRLRLRGDVPGQFRSRRSGSQADGSARGLPQGGHPGLERAAGPCAEKELLGACATTPISLKVRGAKEVQRRRRWWR